MYVKVARDARVFMQSRWITNGSGLSVSILTSIWIKIYWVGDFEGRPLFIERYTSTTDARMFDCRCVQFFHDWFILYVVKEKFVECPKN